MNNQPSNKILKFFKNLIFPENLTCVICDDELNNEFNNSICDACLKTLPYLTGSCCLKCNANIKATLSNYCLYCKSHNREFKRNFSVFSYDMPINMLIIDLKYNKKKYLAKPLSKLMLSKFAEMDISIDLIVPIPLHESKLKSRGFNQAELLCECFKKHYCVDRNLVKRIKNTLQQSELNRTERLKNLKDAFIVSDSRKIKNKRILLIDDVFTTGVTIEECAKALKKAGAKEVYSFTLAHANLEKFT